MNRYHLALAILPCIFASAGQALAFNYFALSTHQCTIEDFDGEKLSFDSYDEENGGYYHIFNADLGVTEMSIGESGSISAIEPEGLRFKGWYTKKGGWTGREKHLVSEIDMLVEENRKIASSTIAAAGLWNGCPTVVAKYVPTYHLSVKVLPEGSGTVSGGGVYEKGASATLTATANAGWTFEKWADGEKNNLRTISGVDKTATYTAVFVKQMTVRAVPSSFGRGTVAVTPQQKTYLTNDVVTLTVQPDEGYAFVRWSDGSVKNPLELTVGGGVDLKAYIEPKSILVTFEGGAGALLDMDRKRVSYNCAYGELATCTRVGYSFAGWYTMPSDGSKIESTTTVLITDADAQTLYARWTANSYKVTFDAAGGSAVTGSRDVTYDSTYGTLPSCTRTGYTFAGWWTAASDGTKVEPTTKVAITESQTLFAHWTPNEYSLTVSPNGGRYAGQNIDCELSEKLRYDAKACNAIDVATRENYTLLGYYATSGGGARLYDANGRNVKCDYWTAGYPNGTFKGTSALRVYALWSPNDSAVNLDKQGGAGGTDSVTVKYDAMVPAIASLPTRTGYAFEGYYTVKNGGGRKYYNANGEGLEKWTSSGTTVLYANWTPYGYKVGYEFDGGTPGSDAPASAKVGTAFRVSAPTRKGHAFAGWNVTGGGADYGTAKWGVASDSAATSVTNGTMACFDPSKDYVYFLDLATAKDVSVTLKANWTPVEYSLSVNPNGGTYRGSTGSTTLNEKLFYGATNLNEIGAAERKGYALQDYSTEQNGGESVYDEKGRSKSGTFWTASSPDGTYKGTKDLRVYARWTANTYKVLFDANGGTTSTGSGSVTYDSTYGLLPTPSRTGYTFMGWWTEKENGRQITETTPVEITEALTLYAHWTVNKYSLTINLKDGETYEDAQGRHTGKYVLQEPLIFDATNLNRIAVATKKDDWIFQGYKVSDGTLVYDAQGRNLKGAQGTYWTADYPNGTYCHDGNIELTATWTDPRPRYEITVASASPTAGSVNVEAAGTYVEGSNVVLTATANAGYSFAHWTKDGELVSTDNPYAFAAKVSAQYTAVFTGNVYTVTYVGGQFAEPKEQPKTVVFGSPYGDPPTEFEWSGYRLRGWNTDSVGKGDWIEKTNMVTNASRHNLYAIWDEIPPVVTFVDPYGWFDPIQKDYVKGQTISNAPPETENWKKDGYWRDNKTDWEPSLSETVTGDMEVKAKWTSVADVLDCSNLTFNVNEGNWRVNHGQPPASKRGGSWMQLDSCSGKDVVSVEITEPGMMVFHYKGANLTAKGFGDQDLELPESSVWSCATGLVETATVERFALVEFTCIKTGFDSASLDWVTWIPRREMTYGVEVVSGDESRGMVTKNPVQESYGIGSIVMISAIPHVGYAFEKWSDGSTESNLTVTVSSNAVYTASFTACVYRVTFEANGGGDLSFASTNVMYDSTYGELPTSSRMGYAFDGWWTAESGGTEIEPTTKVTIVDAQTLYAHWTANEYAVTFNANGGAGGITECSVTYGKYIPKLESLPEREHHAFQGFFDAPTNGTKYCNGDGTGAKAWDKAADATLYAYWTKDDECTLYVSVAEGSHGNVAKEPAADKYHVGDDVTITATPDEGYAFEKWSDGSTESNRTVKVSSDAEYSASFTACVYRVTFEANGGGDLSFASTNVMYDSTYGELPTSSRMGYAFDGWWTAESGGTKIEPTTKVTIAGAQTLYAHWTANEYAVTFNANDGEAPSFASTNVIYGTAYGELPTCTRVGYTFAGWWTEKEGGQQITETTVVAITGPQTLYAHWQQDVGDISHALDCNNLVFKATGGWNVFTNDTFAQTGSECLKTTVLDEGTGLTATIKESGTLSFYWNCCADSKNTKLNVMVGESSIFEGRIIADKSTDGWQSVSLRIEVNAGEAVQLKFACGRDCRHLAIDCVTWTPDGE